MKDLNFAFHLWKEMHEQQIVPNIVTYNTMLATVSDPPLNENLFEQRLKIADILREDMIERGIKPTSITYNTLLNLYTKTGTTEKARDLVKNMARERVELNEVGFNTLIAHCNSIGEHHWAVKY